MEEIVETAPKTKPATPPQNAATVATANADGETTEANVVCCGPLEARFHTAMLDHPTKITAVFVAGVLATMCMPLFLTKTASFGEARAECYARATTQFIATWPDLDIHTYTQLDIYPSHIWVCASCVVSVTCFMAWIFLSPHRSDQKSAVKLDQALGSYCFFSVMASLFVALASLKNCVSDYTSYVIIENIHSFGVFGLSVLFTHGFLCHRYLLEKAVSMRSNEGLVMKLGQSLKWELRSMIIVPLGMVVTIISKPIGEIVVACVACLILATNFTFSITAMAAFTKPIFDILRADNATKDESFGHDRLQNTLSMILCGCILSVLSSSLFYVNGMLWAILGDPITKSIWLNPFIVGLNLAAIMNDFGIFLVCGILRKVGSRWSHGALVKKTRKMVSVSRRKSMALAHHGPNYNFLVKQQTADIIRVHKAADFGVDALIAQEVETVDHLKVIAPKVTKWLKEKLPLAHTDKDLKNKIHNLLGAPLYTPNLAYLGYWEDLIDFCRMEALKMGREMQAYYDYNDLGNVLGEEKVPQLFGKVKICQGGSSSTGTNILSVSPCEETEFSRRQDHVLPLPFPRSEGHSQLWSEKMFIHCLRMIAMGIDQSFQHDVFEICRGSEGDFYKTGIKGFTRMKNKCISKDDHYFEAYPRPALNSDINRNCCTFEKPEHLVSFIENMKRHPKFGGHPVRTKNMFLFSEARIEEQFHYRTVMINWVYTPGFTYRELATRAEGMWGKYYDFETVPGLGGRDTSESWGTWRDHIKGAKMYLESEDIAEKPVQFIVETQLLLGPYLKARQEMHFLYKVCRAENPAALHNDFRVQNHQSFSFRHVEKTALEEMEIFLVESGDVNMPSDDERGVTRLWEAAEKGHEKAVCAILQHPEVRPNDVRVDTQTTPLLIAAHYGHRGVCQAILSHHMSDVNRGNIKTGRSPLFEAAQEDHVEVVMALLASPLIDVNQQCTLTGVTPLAAACERGHECVVNLLLAARGITIDSKLTNGSTPMSIACANKNAKIVDMLSPHLQTKWGKKLPQRCSYNDDSQYVAAVSEACKCIQAEEQQQQVTRAMMKSFSNSKNSLREFASSSKMSFNNRSPKSIKVEPVFDCINMEEDEKRGTGEDDERGDGEDEKAAPCSFRS